ncbi:HK97-gp10 family putative phage morphogenesis protein [Solibacillus sp. FSL R7-0682]|uniref:HK97-gp10 family putative phage morphogenesis protein n=1 Tax=Solibacillus sp. FSL R7-0682 TaxID=2921690 RepID=UPI0030FAACE7
MTIRGLDSLIRKLDSLGGNSQKALKKGIQKATLQVQGDAKDLAPIGDSGFLRNSIQAKTEEKNDVITGKVSTDLFYGPYVEFGTGQRGEGSPSPPKSPLDVSYRQDWTGMEAQPYLYPALKQNEENVKMMVKEELKKEIRKLGGS